MTIKQNTPQLRFKGFNEDLIEKTLRSLVDTVRSYPLSRSFETSDLTTYRYIHYGDIHRGKLKIIDSQSLMPNIGVGNYELLKNGDLVVADASEDYEGVANPCVINFDLQDKVVAGLHTIALRPLDADSLYLYYKFSTGSFKEHNRFIATGTKVLGISAKKLLKYQSHFPNIKEQTAIGNLFQNIDKTIALQRRKYKQTQNLKQSLLSKMFPQAGQTKPEIRLKGFSGDWVENNLGEIASFSKGKGLSKADIDINGINPCIHYGELFTSYGRYINEVRSSTNLNIDTSVLSQENDILMPTSDVTPNGLAKASAIDIPNVILGGDTLIIRSKKLVNSFFAYFVESHQRDIIELTTGTTVYHIYGKDLGKLTLLIPPDKSEQIAVTDIFKQLDDTLALQAKQLKTLEHLKKALLAKMFV